MGLVDIGVIVIVWLASRWLFDWWTARRHSESDCVVVVICNNQTTGAYRGRTSFEPIHDEEWDGEERPEVIEIGDLRIEAYPRVRAWHTIGAVSAKEGVEQS